jgi:hypothetical protein
MNVDARPGIDVRADLGARMPAVLWIAVGLLTAGAVFLTGGLLMIAGAMRARRASQARSSVTGPAAPESEYERSSHAAR